MDNRSIPRDSREEISMSLVRVRPEKPLVGVILSTQWLGAEIHYVGGRSQLCPPDGMECGCCKEGNVSRWRGYFIAAIGHPKGHIRTVEVTERCCPTLVNEFAKGQSLRGRTFRLSRINRKINAPLNMDFTGELCAEQLLPGVPPVHIQIARIYKAPVEWLVNGYPIEHGSEALAVALDHVQKGVTRHARTNG